MPSRKSSVAPSVAAASVAPSEAAPCVAVEAAAPCVAAVAAVAAVPSSVTGCVKWFNNKAGYGFISVTDAQTGITSDIFVHHTAIQVGQSQYKYLVQGEYVVLTLAEVESDKHKIQAADVRGVNGGKLMCETRNEMRGLREDSEPAPSMRQSSAPTSMRQSSAPTRPAPTRQSYARQASQIQQVPQLGDLNPEEWMVVPRRRHDVQTQPRRGKISTRQPRVELS